VCYPAVYSSEVVIACQLGSPVQMRNSCRRALENDLSRKLHVEGLAGPDAGTAEEIADRVGHKAVGSDGSTSGCGSQGQVKHCGARRADFPRLVEIEQF